MALLRCALHDRAECQICFRYAAELMSMPTASEARHCSACEYRRSEMAYNGSVPPHGAPVYLATDAAVPLGWINYATESPYFNMAVPGPLPMEQYASGAPIEAVRFETVALRQMRPLPGMVFWVLEDSLARLFQCAGPHFTPNPANRYIRREQDNAACRELYTTSPAAPGTVQRNPARASSPLRLIEDWSADAATVIAEHRAKWLKKSQLPDARKGPAPVPAAARDEFGEPVEVTRPEPLAPPPSFLPAMRRA